MALEQQKHAGRGRQRKAAALPQSQALPHQRLRKVINSPVYEDYMDYLDHHNSTTADSQLEYDDFVRQLNQMLAKLPKTQQEIIRLSKLEMLNNQEIAEKLNYSEQTVKNQLSMGLKQLRQLISNRTNLMWLLFLV